MVTIRQIAKTVGVSSATVSRVLNFDATLSITPGKRQAIIETAEALNYATPRNRNRASQQGISRVALVHFLKPDQELLDPYYIGVRLGIESRCQMLKIETLKVYAGDSLPEPHLLQNAPGVIAIGSHSDAEIEWLSRYSRHLVFADFAPPGDDLDCTFADLPLAMEKLLGKLLDAGYRRIGFAGWVEGSSNDPLGETRCAAYRDFLAARGLFDPAICLTEPNAQRNSEMIGYRITQRLLAAAEPPDVIVCCNDNVAVGAYRAINERGLAIPDDVAVASFNDISVAQFLNPPLSTVHLPSEEIGETAVELLLERMTGRTVAKRVSLGTSIIWRSSTKAVS